MERLREQIGVEVSWPEVSAADGPEHAEIVEIDRPALGLVGPRLAPRDAGAGRSSLRLRFTTTLRSSNGGVAPRVVAEPAVEAALDPRVPDGPVADDLRDLLRLDDPETLVVLLDAARVAPIERAARAAVLAVATRARVCAWEARELRPESPCTLVVEHGLTLDHGAAVPPGWMPFGGRRLRLGPNGVESEEEVGLTDPPADGAWIAVEGGTVRAAASLPTAVTPSAVNGDPRERARRRASALPWPTPDARILHLAATLDAEERVTAARLKTLVRLLGSARPDPLASVLFAERIVPMHHVLHVLAPPGASRDAKLRGVLRAAERSLDDLPPADAFRLTRVLAEAVTGDAP